eukprot:m.7990 g.7990  ORF g.7990 m.7990 type:complete len:321 (+) comp2980_c1_seq1:162-1124(+)
MNLALLLLSFVGLYGCYITYGILQEGVYKFESPVDGSKFQSTLTMLLFQAFLNTVCSWLFNMFYYRKVTLPPVSFAAPGTSFIVAMLCSNEALRYVSYPTQVLAKSCKLVPVLLVSVLFYGKAATLLQYAHVALVTAGIVLFRLKPSSDDSESNSTYGLLLLLVSLILDGYTGPTQKKLSDSFKESKGLTLKPTELMFFCNFWGAIAVLIALFAFGENLDGVTYLLHPQHTKLLWEVTLFSLAGTLGQFFIYFTLLEFGSLTLTTITTTRKFFTILFSVVMYGHNLSAWQWGGVGVVFAGLSLDGVDKYLQKKALNMKVD